MQVCYSYSIYQNEVIIRTNAIAIIKANICTLVTNKYNVMFHIWFHAACTRVKLQSSGISYFNHMSIQVPFFLCLVLKHKPSGGTTDLQKKIESYKREEHVYYYNKKEIDF